MPPSWTSANDAGPLTSTRACHGRPMLHLESERPARDRGFESPRFRPLTRAEVLLRDHRTAAAARMVSVVVSFSFLQEPPVRARPTLAPEDTNHQL